MTSFSLSRYPAPERIVIFRALNLGDFLCVVPALRMLRHAFPDAHITLVGLSNARECIARFTDYINAFVDFPGDPLLPEREVRADAVDDFYATMQQHRFGLALQMHGSGRYSNAITQRLGALQWAGFVPDASQQTPWKLAWPDTEPEVMRYVALLRHLGLPIEKDVRLELPLTDRDHRKADALAQCLHVYGRHTVFMHPGARMASRRWPAHRFIEVGRQLVKEGWRIAVTGSLSECGLTARVASGIGTGAVDCGGLTDLGMLASMLQRAPFLICNDTGVSHVAAAMRTPSVVIASGSDVNRWAPLDTGLHTVLHADVPCRPCAHDDCPVPGHPCATRITTDDVLAAAHLQLIREQTHEMAANL